MQDRRLSNRLAALATALDDAMFAGVDGLSESAVAALHVVRRAEPVAIQDIARRIGLTHSATVRLVDRLEKDWLVRRLSRRGREVMVESTARGKRRARDLQDARLAAAETFVAALDGEARLALGSLVDRMLARATQGAAGAAERICRLCDQGSCRGAGCPVEDTACAAAADAIEAG